MEKEEIELTVRTRPYLAYLILGGWAPPYLLYEIIVTPENTAALTYALLTIIVIFSWLFVAFWLHRVRLRDDVLTQKGFLRITKCARAGICDPAMALRNWLA